MRIAITGSTGLIGSALATSLERDGHRVHRVVRDRAEAGDGDVYWSVRDGEIDAARLEGVDAVVHLAGQPIAAKRWTDEQKRAILRSRTEGTRLLSEALAGLDTKPTVFLSGSAQGYYGDRGDEVLDETSSPGTGFLPEVCIAWEAATAPAEAAGIPVTHLRTGIVLDGDGGALERMLLPFKAGVGGRIASGRQWMSWISLDDWVRATTFLLQPERHGELTGPVNLTAPNPVRNAEFTEAFGEELQRPTVMIIPGFAIEVLFGEMGKTLVVEGQRVLPKRLQEAGFEYAHTRVREGLRAALA